MIDSLQWTLARLHSSLRSSVSSPRQAGGRDESRGGGLPSAQPDSVPPGWVHRLEREPNRRGEGAAAAVRPRRTSAAGLGEAGAAETVPLLAVADREVAAAVAVPRHSAHAPVECQAGRGGAHGTRARRQRRHAPAEPPASAAPVLQQKVLQPPLPPQPPCVMPVRAQPSATSGLRFPPERSRQARSGARCSRRDFHRCRRCQR